MKENMNFSVDVTALSEYINRVGSGEIIEALAASAPSIQYLATQGGVNEKTDLHLMEVSGSFSDGKSCQVADNTEFEFTDRQLVPAFVKQESKICEADFIGKWLAYKNRFTASDNDLEFAGAMILAFQKNVGENLEKFIWNGGTINSVAYDGLVTIVERDASTHKVSCASTGSTYEMIEKLVIALPAKSANKTEIFVSHNTMMELKRDLLKNDFRLFDLEFSNGAEKDEHTIKLPVFGTLVHEIDGLAGNAKAYALVPEHTVYGYSVDGAQADIKAVYDEVNDVHIMRAKLSVAVQIAYPSEAYWAVKE